MFQRFLTLYKTYPLQFWLILAGMLISTIGTSMIFPFLTIYVSERLEIPLTEVAGLISLNGFLALFASIIAGPTSDRFGRKWLMVLSLAGNGLTYFFLAQASTFSSFAVLMAMRGLFQPLYRIGTNAMVSDLISPVKRPDAFALMRMSNNVGIALGPALGGFIVATSYSFGFYIAALTLLIFGILIALFAKETAPSPGLLSDNELTVDSPWSSTYHRVIGESTFMSFIGSYTLFKVCSVMLWVLSAVYAKQKDQTTSRKGFRHLCAVYSFWSAPEQWRYFGPCVI